MQRVAPCRGVLPPIEEADDAQLASLLEPESVDHAWDNADLAVLWRQQLAVRLVDEVSSEDPGVRETLAALGRLTPPRLFFWQVLFHPGPPWDALDLVRRWAKRRIETSKRSGLEPIARAMYYAVIAASLRSEHPRPTSLSGKQLRLTFGWVISRPWIDVATRRLCEQAREQVGMGGEGGLRFAINGCGVADRSRR